MAWRHEFSWGFDWSYDCNLLFLQEKESKIRLNMEFKQVILVRKDLNMDKGKMSSQVAHASVDVIFKSDQKIVETWRKQGMKKSILKVENKSDLLKYLDMAKKAGLKTSLITDAGRTFFDGTSTTTCGAVGPDEESKIDAVTANLKLY